MEWVVLDVGKKALIVAFQTAGPILAIGLIVGLIVSIFQAMTQIQEMTLTFIPKMIAIAIGFMILGPWILETLVRFAASMISGLPNMVR